MDSDGGARGVSVLSCRTLTSKKDGVKNLHCLRRLSRMERLTKRQLLSELANSLDSSLAREVIERYRKKFDISDVEKLLLAKIREEISDEAQENQD